MPRFTSGSVFIPREVIDGPIGQSGTTYAVFSWLVHKMNRFESKLHDGEKVIQVLPGQLVTSNCEISCHFNYTRMTVQRHLRMLVELGEILDEPTTQGRKITVLNHQRFISHVTRRDTPSEHIMEREVSLSIEPLSSDPSSSGSDEERDASSSPKVKKKAAKVRTTTWEEADPLAKVFSHLVQVPKYQAVFDREHDRKVILEHKARYSLSEAQLEELAYRFRCWADPGSPAHEKMLSPRGTLATFVRGFAQDPKNKPAPKKESEKIELLTEDSFDF